MLFRLDQHDRFRHHVVDTGINRVGGQGGGIVFDGCSAELRSKIRRNRVDRSGRMRDGAVLIEAEAL